jgi:hypothetical protein
MSDDFIRIEAKAGADCDFTLTWADVDTSVDPPVETPIDLTGYSAEINFRTRDGQENALQLTTESGGGIEELDDTGEVNATLTVAQLATLIETTERVAFRVILITGAGKRLWMCDGFVEIAQWP